MISAFNQIFKTQLKGAGCSFQEDILTKREKSSLLDFILRLKNPNYQTVFVFNN